MDQASEIQATRNGLHIARRVRHGWLLAIAIISEHPFVDFICPELPKPTELMCRHVPAINPLVDGVTLNAEILSDLVHREPTAFHRCFSLVKPKLLPVEVSYKLETFTNVLPVGISTSIV